MSERVYDAQWAFSSKKQAAFGTALVNGSLTLSHLFKGPDFAERTPEIVTDLEDIGSGEFQKTQEIERWDTRLRRSFDLTSLLAGWVGAYGLGAVTTTQPDAGGNPTVYDHSCKFNTASHQNPYTTIVEKVGTGTKRSYPDLCIARIELSGEGKGRVQGAMDLVGSGRYVDSTLTMPSLNDGGSLLKMSGLKFEIGPTASEVDVSSRLRTWRWVIDNDLQEDDGYYPNSGLYRGRLEYGARKQELSFSLMLNTSEQELDDLEAESALKVIITCTGKLISSTYYHELTLTIPEVRYRMAAHGQDGPFVLVNLECEAFDDGSTFPVELLARNTQTVYLDTEA